MMADQVDMDGGDLCRQLTTAFIRRGAMDNHMDWSARSDRSHLLSGECYEGRRELYHPRFLTA